MSRAFWFAVCAASVLFTTTGYARDLTGTYQGALIVDGRPQPVWINIKNMDVSEKNLVLSYSLPKNCTIYFQYAGEIEGVNYYYKDNDHCKSPADTLAIKSINGRDIEYSLEKNRKAVESSVLSRK